MLYIKRRAKEFAIRNVMKFFYYTRGVDNKKIVFKSFDNQFSDNPRAICEKLHELNPKLRFLWLFKNPDDVSENVPKYIIKIKDRSLRKIYELSTAKVWVDNCTKVASTWKGKKQYYIQTWHGDKAFKKIGYDAGKIPFNFEKAPVFDLAIAGSDYGEKKYRNAFHYNGKVLNVGTPRNDILINKDEKKIERIKKILKLEKNQKILLYTPTFRDNNKNKTQKTNGFIIEEALKILEKKYTGEWICLARTHHLVEQGFDIDKTNKIIDVSLYDDIADLIAIADCMVTDYSSCAGDFALTKRLLILYHEDISDYTKNSRDFYFDISSSPYFRAHSMKEFKDIVYKLSEEQIIDNCNKILDFYKSRESGNAAEIISKIILEEINGK